MLPGMGSNVTPARVKKGRPLRSRRVYLESTLNLSFKRK